MEECLYTQNYSFILSTICVSSSDWPDKQKIAVGHELSDVLIYLVSLADRCNIDLSTVVLKKFEINKQKYPVDKVKGCSKKYTEYDKNDDAEEREVCP